MQRFWAAARIGGDVASRSHRRHWELIPAKIREIPQGTKPYGGGVAAPWYYTDGFLRDRLYNVLYAH